MWCFFFTFFPLRLFSTLLLDGLSSDLPHSSVVVLSLALNLNSSRHWWVGDCRVSLEVTPGHWVPCRTFSRSRNVGIAPCYLSLNICLVSRLDGACFATKLKHAGSRRGFTLGWPTVFFTSLQIYYRWQYNRKVICPSMNLKIFSEYKKPISMFKDL